jgi:poly-gamma-glutamate synthesis protein (capsule biosynthesis protein)
MTAAGTAGLRRSLGLLLAAVAVTGCTAPPAPPGPERSSTPAPTSAASGEAQPQEPARAVRIAVAGDVHFEGVLRARLDDPSTALRPVRRWLAAADVTILNLETSVGTGGTPQPGKRFTFSAGPAAFEALAAAGVDVVSMANNHALDFGRDRLPGTLRAVRSAAAGDPPLAVVGIGRDADRAFRPATIDVDGTVVATLAATVADLDPTADRTGQWAATPTRAGTADALDPGRLLRAVRRADTTADVVVAYLHWGVQGERCPSPDQEELAGRLVAAGADVVVGSHAHQLQGDGRLGGGYVAYGLGNFAWYSPGTGATSRTGVLTLTVRPPAQRSGRARVTRAAWRYGVIGPNGLARPTRAASAGDLRVERESLRACSGLTR